MQTWVGRSHSCSRGKKEETKRARCICGIWTSVVTCCELVEECVNSCHNALGASLVKAYRRYNLEETGAKIEVTFSPAQSKPCSQDTVVFFLEADSIIVWDAC